SALKDLNATGKVQMGFLQVRGIKLSNLKADVKAAGGRLELPHTANLYEGSVNGALGAQHDGRIAMKETLQGVAIGPLLKDASAAAATSTSATARSTTPPRPRWSPPPRGRAAPTWVSSPASPCRCISPVRSTT